MDRNRTREEGGSRRRRRVDGGVNKHTGFDDTSTEGRTPTKTQATTYFFLNIKRNGFNGYTFLLLSIYTQWLCLCLYRMKKSQKFRHCPTTLLPFTVTTSLA